MSVSVSAVPFLLIGALVNSAINVTSALASSATSNGQYIHLEGKILEEIFNKEFQTNIVDEETLIKTLTEHGARNITTENGTITCDCEAFRLTFTKEGKNNTYTMIATYNQDKGLNELATDLGNEYTINAQEISYNKIKERLEQKNLEIAEEEIYDDNTIVLTVNLD